MSLSYPTSLPTDDILRVIQVLRSGALESEKALVVKTVWEVAGFAASMTVGEPGQVLAPSGTPLHMKSAAPTPVLSDTEVLDYLNDYCSHAKKGVANAAAIPWLSILKWAITLLAGVL